MKEMEINQILELLKENGIYVTPSVNNGEIDWHELLEKTTTGKIKATYNNHKIVFENAIKGDLRYNEFERVIECNENAIDNNTLSILRNQFESYGNFRSKEVMRDFLNQYSYENRYNPIKRYLESLEWDGVQRVQTMFIDWLKVEDNIVNRKLAEKWLVSGVKRIYENGCPIEGMIVLVDKQGTGKSTFIHRLGLRKYSVEASFDLRNETKCAETFNRSWIVNFDELKSIIKADPELTKTILTRQSDTCRLAYREEPETYKRHCIFIGSTNDASILKDYSDRVERRYWMMQCNVTDKRNIFDNFTDDIVNQLWAEAYYIYKNDTNYNISISDFTDEEMEMMYNTQRNFKSFNGDDLSNDLMEMLDGDYGFNNRGTFDSKDDFVNQALGKEADKEKDKHSLFSKIDAIPFSYINYYLQIIKEKRPNTYIAEALADKWRDVQRYDYDGNRLHCLVRKQVA